MDEMALLNGEQIPGGDLNPQQLDQAIDQPAPQVNGDGGIPTAAPACATRPLLEPAGSLLRINEPHTHVTDRAVDTHGISQ